MSVCPFCQRRLLSQASPACNWCGKEIPDAAYQQRAAVEREAYFAHQALHDAESLAAIEGIGLNMGGLWLSPLEMLRTRPPAFRAASRPAPSSAPLPAVDPTPPAEEAPPEATTEGRFQHLEL